MEQYKPDLNIFHTVIRLIKHESVAGATVCRSNGAAGDTTVTRHGVLHLQANQTAKLPVPVSIN